MTSAVMDSIAVIATATSTIAWPDWRGGRARRARASLGEPRLRHGGAGGGAGVRDPGAQAERGPAPVQRQAQADELAGDRRGGVPRPRAARAAGRCARPEDAAVEPRRLVRAPGEEAAVDRA